MIKHDGQNKLINLLSMAARANKIISGDFAVGKAVTAGKVRLLLLADDTAQSTGSEYKEIAVKYNIPIFLLPIGKDDLGHCIGKNKRAAAAVCDEGFAKNLQKILTDI